MRVCDLSVGMLFYCFGNEHLFALVLDGEGKLERYELASCAEVLPKVDTLMDALGQPLGWVPSRRNAVVRQFADDWGAALLPPPDALKPFDILLIVPHHSIHGVPLHLVRVEGEALAIH